MSPDWAANAEAVPYANLENPQTLNLYGYVGNNPLTNVDSTGHFIGVFNLINAPAILQDNVQEYQRQLLVDGQAGQQQNLSSAGLRFIEQQETVGGVPNLTPYDASGKKHKAIGPSDTVIRSSRVKTSQRASLRIRLPICSGLMSRRQ